MLGYESTFSRPGLFQIFIQRQGSTYDRDRESKIFSNAAERLICRSGPGFKRVTFLATLNTEARSYGEARIDPGKWDCRKNIHLDTSHTHDGNIKKQQQTEEKVIEDGFRSRRLCKDPADKMLPLRAGCVLGALLIGASTAKPVPKTENAVVPGAYMIEFTDDHASLPAPSAETRNG